MVTKNVQKMSIVHCSDVHNYTHCEVSFYCVKMLYNLLIFKPSDSLQNTVT